MTDASARIALERRSAETAALLPDLVAKADAAAQVVLAGRHPRQKAGRSDTFWQFRDYTPGDPVASIDWRQSARLDRRLLVRQTEWEQPQTFCLWCGGDEDFDYAGDVKDTKRFVGQVITLALGMIALRAGERVAIWGPEEPPRAGHQVSPLLAETLIRSETKLDQLQPRSGAIHLLVSDFHTEPEELHRAFDRVRDVRGQAVAVVVEDPSEEEFAYQGSRRFEGPKGEARKFFGDTGAVRAAYLEARAAHHDALRRAVRGPDEAVIFHRTDQALPPLLMQISQRFAEERA